MESQEPDLTRQTSSVLEELEEDISIIEELNRLPESTQSEEPI